MILRKELNISRESSWILSWDLHSELFCLLCVSLESMIWIFRTGLLLGGEWGVVGGWRVGQSIIFKNVKKHYFYTDMEEYMPKLCLTH